ncbi:hypothetical protein R69608_03261 [Paraburkholderia nemoris]|nr:hypothetical protein R69608_03261 [Paraburkholderia nemoris]
MDSPALFRSPLILLSRLMSLIVDGQMMLGRLNVAMRAFRVQLLCATGIFTMMTAVLSIFVPR